MKRLLINLGLLVSLVSSVAAQTETDWPQFLGTQRNGISTDPTPITDSFSDDGPKRLWKYSIGAGFAGPVVSAGHVFVFHRVDNEARLDCLDAAKGTKVWSFGYATNYRDQFGFDEGPRSSPTVAQGTVFTYGAEGMVHAVDAATGKLVWKRDLAADFDSEQGYFGRAGAPLLVGETLLVQPGGEKAAVVGLDSKTGKTLWKAGDQDAGYASPLLWKTKRGECVVFWLREGLLGVSPVDGKVWFDVPFRSEMDASVNAATPVIIDESHIFTSACYDTGAALWKLTEDGLESAWKAGEKLDAHYATPILFKGALYGMHGRQEMGMELRCIDPMSGKLHWTSGRMAVGELIAADSKLIVLTEKGELILVKPTTTAFTVLDRAQILGATHRSAPAISKCILYARDGSQLVAVSLTK